MSNWRYFNIEEFECKCGCGAADMDETFVEALDELRGWCGFPFVVSSGYRCPLHNQRVSTTGRTGPHTTGKAADILCSGEQASYMLEKVLQVYWVEFKGVGIHQKGPHAQRFIHLDGLDRPHRQIWTY